MIAMIFRQYCVRYLVFTAHCLGAGAIWKTQEAFLRIFTGWQLKAGNTTSKKPAEKTHQQGKNTHHLADYPAPVVSELARAGPRSGRSGRWVFQVCRCCLCLGLLRSPTQGKPAHHNDRLKFRVNLRRSFVGNERQRSAAFSPHSHPH